MSRQLIEMTDHLYAYYHTVCMREPELLARLREETGRLDRAVMQISPEQGQFMSLLTELMGTKKALELGSFTGYSALCIALALPADGRLICSDVSEEWTAMARRYWEEAGVADKIDLRLAPGMETTQALLDGGEAGSFDFIFIDADKDNYEAYYERAVGLARPGGLIAIDNVLWSGRVADQSEQSETTQIMRRINARVHADKRVSMAMLPLGDGLTLARKR